MNATNRVANRLVLGVFALVLFGLALLAIWVLPANSNLVGLLTSEIVIVIGGAAILFSVAMIVFLLTRGGGRAEVVWRNLTADGKTLVDQSVADEMLTGEGFANRGVGAARSKAFTVRRAPAIYVGISVRSDARPAEILESVDHRVAVWDTFARTEVPVLVHFTRRGVRL